MPKKIELILFFLLFVIATPIVYAEDEETCNYKLKTELKQEAWNMQFDYEYFEETKLVEGENFPVIYRRYNIIAYNLTPNLVLQISNEDYGILEEFTYGKAKDGKIEYAVPYKSELANYKLNVFAFSGPCAGELLITKKLTTPIRNDFYTDDNCVDNSDFYLCQEFLMFEPVDYATFLDKLEAYKLSRKDEVEEEEKTDKNDFKKYAIIGGSVILVVIIVGGIIYLKKRKDRIL